MHNDYLTWECMCDGHLKKRDLNINCSPILDLHNAFLSFISVHECSQRKSDGMHTEI